MKEVQVKEEKAEENGVLKRKYRAKDKAEENGAPKRQEPPVAQGGEKVEENEIGERGKNGGEEGEGVENGQEEKEKDGDGAAFEAVGTPERGGEKEAAREEEATEQDRDMPMPDGPRVEEGGQEEPTRESLESFLPENTLKGPKSTPPRGPKNPPMRGPKTYARVAAETNGGRTVDLRDRRQTRKVTATTVTDPWRTRDLWQAWLHGAPNWQESCLDPREANKALEEFREKANRHLGKDAPY
ncbi:hypothetical protein BDZ91DRAFT_801913 [Kalaharituber pfeilii]|nr:hypothetical protein BDZ91DRAFT_801913 [Kalaharituber pfeilii]